MKYKRAAERQIQWAINHIKSKTWFDNMGFKPHEVPLTHTIAYTLRGLLESSIYLGQEDNVLVLDVIRRSCEALITRYLSRNDSSHFSKYLPARLNEEYSSSSLYSCLSGNLQFSIIMMKLYNTDNDIRFKQGAANLIQGAKLTQLLESRNPGIEGGIAGSYPIWGGYNPFAYQNWAVKFFADAIMLEEELKQESDE
jgi:hypothetical protein